MRAIVLGAGPIGLATAMLLAKDGHEVTVLEKDRQSPPATPDEVWGSWERKGVAQFRQTHFMQAKFRHILDAELPEVRDELVALGARRASLLDAFKVVLGDPSPREGDDRFESLTGRRPIVDGAFAHAAEDTPGVKIVRGVAVGAAISERAIDGVPHVSGVRTTDGETIAADLVIDATGRRSKFVEWVTALGGVTPHEEISESGFAYYSRYYTSDDGMVPEFRSGFVSSFDSFFVLTLPSDNATWTIAVVAMAGDHLFKNLRRNEIWERVVRSVPVASHWIDARPLCDVVPMAGAMDRYRRAVVDGRPVVTGMVPVGDSWACTNPTMGRGISLGLMHAVAFRDALRDHPDDPTALALEFDRVTEERLTPWYRQQIERDQRRSIEVKALIEGRTPPPNENPMAPMQMAFAVGASHDPDLARAFLDNQSVLALPHEIMTRPGIAEKVATYVGQAPRAPEGPTRDQLAALLN